MVIVSSSPVDVVPYPFTPDNRTSTSLKRNYDALRFFFFFYDKGFDFVARLMKLCHAGLIDTLLEPFLSSNIKVSYSTHLVEDAHDLFRPNYYPVQ
jgi:hypothetical protein